MKKNINILFYVIIVFLISFSILFLELLIFESDIFTNHIEIKNFIGSKDKIFLFGTSYVSAIDTTHVQNMFDKIKLDVVMIHTKTTGISDMLTQIDNFISYSPKMIVYGVGFRDIGFQEGEFCTFSNIPRYDLKENLQKNNNFNLLNSQIQILPTIQLENPKHVTLTIFKNFFGAYQKDHVLSFDGKKTKILLQEPGFDKIIPIDTLNQGDDRSYCMDFKKRNSELNNLNKIFSNLKNNEIDVIVFIPPYTKAYLERLSPELRLSLTNDIQKISEKYNFDFYDLSSKFENFDIFTNHTHVARNPDSSIYTKEISSLIISKLEK